MSMTLIGSTLPLNQEFDVALVDLDGVTYRGPHAIPSAPPALERARAAGMKLIYVTNNANREPESVAQHLTELGIPAGRDEVLTAAQAAAAVLASRLAPGDKVLVVGGPGLRTAVAGYGFVIVESADDAPVAVVQGFSPDIAWTHLAEAAYAVRNGAWFLATNLDKTLPNERGLAPGNGSLVETVRTASGITPDAAGKPEPGMFHLAAQTTSARRPLVIGDRLDTDLAGARSAGYPGLMVLTGVNNERDALLAVPGERPAFIGATLDALDEVHPAPHHEDGWWHMGSARARVSHGKLTVEGDSAIDRLRSSCVAAWAASDVGEALALGDIPDLGVSS